MEENLNVNQDTNSSKSTNTRLIGIIAVLAIALVVVSVAFFIFVQRSPKATVKEVAKAVQKADANQLLDTIDPIGIAAFLSCHYNAKGKPDFEDFEDNYEKIVDEIKEGKYSVKVTETEKVDDCKKLTKVTCDISAEIMGMEAELEDIEVYTMKKGFKNYIVGVDFESLEDAIDELEDELEETVYKSEALY